MRISCLVVLAFARYHSSFADSSSNLNSLSVDGEILFDNRVTFSTDAESPEDFFFGSGDITMVPSEPVGQLFPGTDTFDFGTTPVEVALGGGPDLLAATDECYPKQRSCCLRAQYQSCYYIPDSRCSNKAVLCCDRVDSVSLAGIGCSNPAPATQPESTAPEDGGDDSLHLEELEGDESDPVITDEELFNLFADPQRA